MDNAAALFVDAPVEEGHGARAALLTPSGPVTYADLQRLTDRAAHALRARGVEPEQRVAILLPDGPAWVATFFAALKLGAVAVPLHTRLAAAQLRPVMGLRLRPRTYVTLFGVLASTDLRISEALALSPTDVDLPGAVLTVRQTKFRKSRLVPLHATTVTAVTPYVEARRQGVSDRDIETFLIADRGTPLIERMAEHTFAILRARLGWIGRGDYPFPRIHDLRHSYVCRALVRAYHQQQRVDHVIDLLSTYVGHASVSNTYWYVTAIPELLALAGQRFAARAERGDR